jgi:ABC-type multidrug transport system permease subunit
VRAEYRRLLKLLPLAISIYLVLALFVLFMPSFLTWLALLSALTLTIYFLLLLRFRSEGRLRRGSRIPSLFSIGLISLPFIFGFVTALEAYEVGEEVQRPEDK